MKLYSYDTAPNPRRLALFMQFKDINLDTVQVDLRNQEQLGDEYRAINPEMTVPALVLEDGTVLTEVIGICSFLEEIYPEKPLLGTTPLEKAQVLSWDHRLHLSVFMAIAEILRNSSPAFENRALPGSLDVPQIEALGERGRLRFKHAIPELDAMLGKQTWVAGEHFSLADIDLLVAIDFAGWVKESIPESCGQVKAWYRRASEQLG